MLLLAWVDIRLLPAFLERREVFFKHRLLYGRKGVSNI